MERLLRGPSDGRGSPGQRRNNNDRRNPQVPLLPPPAAPGDEVGQRIQELLRDRLTTPDSESPVLKKGEFQWQRDGGPSLREADITRLQPTEMRRIERAGDYRLYRLDDTRQFMVRPSTTDPAAPYPTIELQQRVTQPNGNADWMTTHKIRYRLTD